MKEGEDLTTGSIPLKLTKLALPIMATSFIQTAYGATDMVWIGKLGSGAVSAVGTAGFLVWFGFAFIVTARVGVEIGVSQSIGRKDRAAAKSFAANALQLVTAMALLYSVTLLIFRHQLIGFFKLGDPVVIAAAITYLTIIALGAIVMFLPPVFSGILNGSGDSVTPFWINSLGLVFNIVLDPIMIFGKFGCPALGVAGAAWATVISQCMVTAVFIYYLKSRRSPFTQFRYLVAPCLVRIKKVFVSGFPVGIQSALFTIFSALLARILTQWGTLPIAVHKVGVQIEAISWMSASGFASALSVFVGQNYGAENWDRILRGYFITIAICFVIGLFATYICYFHGALVFGIFISEPEALAAGVIYLKIIAFSQILMCIELVTAGAFNGLGRTVGQSVVSAVMNGLRVPMALWLATAFALGVEGVWWSISLSSIVKGLILFVMFVWLLYRHPAIDNRAVMRSIFYRWDFKYLRDKGNLTGRV